jgi:hypothetical protein
MSPIVAFLFLRRIRVVTAGLVLVVMMALLGCASAYVWSKPGASTAELERERGECYRATHSIDTAMAPLQLATQAAGPPSISTLTNVLNMGVAMIANQEREQQAFEDCMAGHGWERVPQK